MPADRSKANIGTGNTRAIIVANTGDRPVQVGSHFHFYEVNARHSISSAIRRAAFRLNIPAGTAVRFEPGDTREVEIVALGGRAGSLRPQRQDQRQTMSLHLSRRQYAEMFGPTVGDRVRLADTEFFIQVERDLIAEGAGYGNEVKFGGGKVIRDGMGQSPTATDAESLDLVITNALILDAVQGVIKADIGIKGGRIAAIGHAGNPGIQSGITPGMTVGAATEVIAGEGCIVTAGGVSTRTSTSSARNRSNTRWPAASRPCSAAAPARRTAPMPPPARPASGTSTACSKPPRNTR